MHVMCMCVVRASMDHVMWVDMHVMSVVIMFAREVVPSIIIDIGIASIVSAAMDHRVRCVWIRM